jgi:hypothetical protein
MISITPIADLRLRNAMSVCATFAKKMKIVTWWVESVRHLKNRISWPKLKKCAKENMKEFSKKN